MARILTDESTLTRKRKSLAKENDVLGIAIYAELALGILLVVAGCLIFLLTRSWGVLIAGGVLVFLAAGHFVKIRQNRTEHLRVSAGLRGEVEVTKLFEQALGRDAYILNDITVKHHLKSAQIDHLIVSPRGIFVVETKKWRGTIEGDQRDDVWIQTRDDVSKKVRLGNPIKQNQRHVEVLSGLLQASGMEWAEIHSVIVCTSGHAQYLISNRTVPILKPDEAVEYVSGFAPERMASEEEVSEVIDLLMRQ